MRRKAWPGCEQHKYFNNQADAVNKPTTAKYYPNTDVPDYTYVTGIEKERSPYYADNNCVIYSYRNTKSGEYSEMVDYIGYLLENGWSEFEKEENTTSITYSYFKNGSLVMVNYDAELDEINVVVGED